jgi:hypothetical protein
MVARTLFVTAWADKEEEAGHSYPGQELMDAAPSTPPEAELTASELIRSAEVLNGSDLQAMLAQALRAINVEDSPRNRREFGFLLAMQALGHGVGLDDSFGNHGLKVPDIEFYL